MATLGPATDAPGVLDALVAAGVDCARLNCSHGTSADLVRRASEVRAAAGRAEQASASFTQFGEPSRYEVKTSASAEA